MYAPSGWTETSGIRAALSCYWLRKQSRPRPQEFRRFVRVAGPDLRAVAKALPEKNLADRQNAAPTCGEFLELFERFPSEIALGGYLIGPQREDERLTFDGLWICERGTGSWFDERFVWSWFQEQNRQAAIGVPDEVSYSVDAAGLGWWYLWWD